MDFQKKRTIKTINLQMLKVILYSSIQAKTSWILYFLHIQQNDKVQYHNDCTYIL